MRRFAALAIAALLQTATLRAQTTQGLISGRVLNSVTGRPVAGAAVSYTGSTLAAAGATVADASGYYFLPLLSAGTYSVRAAGDAYQPQQIQQLELPVAGRIQLEFRLRPLNDVWETGQYRSVFLPGTKTIVTFYGPDVDSGRSGTFEAQRGERGTLDTSASYVIDPQQISDLPLQGRDVYSMLVALPGVAADTATGRGLGVSVAGQRPSSSNYLLDGVENDNYLITGPLNPVAPEAVQEYRVSTNNYSAEYGRTAGFVANAVTRAGGNQLQGQAYEYLKNDALNAADFADNLNGSGRRPDRENRFGYQAGGPVVRNKVFFSSSLEELVSHSELAAETLKLPTTNFLAAFSVPSSRLSNQLLSKYPGPVIDSQQVVANYAVAPPVVVDRLIALERGDWTSKGGRDHLMARLSLARTSEPDFIWSPYSAFTSGLHQNTTGGAGNWQRSWTPRLTGELKFSYSDDNLWWDRAHPEIPTLDSRDGTTLPGSPAFYAYRNRNRSFETIYSSVWTRNRHVVSAGAGLLLRFNDGYLTAGRDGEYTFSGAVAFALDEPDTFRAMESRLSPNPTVPDYNRAYRYTQTYFFVQDSFRVTPRLTLNFGLRYERFGAPSNTGAVKDDIVRLGPGADFNARLASATLAPQASGALFAADNGDFAPRFGFSWDPTGKSNTVLRGGFGIFYDRPFDNLWQNVRNNNGVLPIFGVSATQTNYLQPVSSAISLYKPVTMDFPGLTLMDPKLRNGYTQTSFVGVRHEIGSGFSVEATGTAALARRLVTTDLVNRPFTTTVGLGYVNQNLPLVSWRSGQGLSDYYAGTLLARYRTRTALAQAAYTWSHSIDNQSDPLTGDFFNLNFTAVGNSGGGGLKSAFAKQFDSHGDRGDSSFDQRHSVFLLGVWQPVARRGGLAGKFTQGWTVSAMAAFRTGTPYTVLAVSQGIPDSGGTIENQRANLVNPSAAVLSNPIPVAGGVNLLNAAAFAAPGANAVGTAGRNAFIGPGLYNTDFSLARTFPVPAVRRLRETLLLTLRIDAFNLLNHANLGNPDNLLGDPGFGVATYGRQGAPSGFPAVSPLNETARQLQVLLRAQF